MRNKTVVIGVFVVATLSACAHVEFPQEDGGLAYYDALPHLLVTTSPECAMTGTVVMIPGDRKIVKLHPGYGVGELSVTLNNGMISAIGQKTDSKVPETIASLAAVMTASAALSTDTSTKCKPTATLYPISKGKVDTANPIPLPINR